MRTAGLSLLVELLLVSCLHAQGPTSTGSPMSMPDTPVASQSPMGANPGSFIDQLVEHTGSGTDPIKLHAKSNANDEES